MAADDLSACKPVVRRLGVERQICAARVKKRARNRLDKIDGWDWGKARIWRLLTEQSFDGNLALLRIERVVRGGGAALRRPRVELSGKWRYATAGGGGRSADEQRDREKQDKVQDGQGSTKTECWTGLG